MNRHIVLLLLFYSSTLERMLVRCSTWSCDEYRCLCACSLRPSVSASLRGRPSPLCEIANDRFSTSSSSPDLKRASVQMWWLTRGDTDWKCTRTTTFHFSAFLKCLFSVIHGYSNKDVMLSLVLKYL